MFKITQQWHLVEIIRGEYYYHEAASVIRELSRIHYEQQERRASAVWLSHVIRSAKSGERDGARRMRRRVGICYWVYNCYVTTRRYGMTSWACRIVLLLDYFLHFLLSASLLFSSLFHVFIILRYCWIYLLRHYQLHIITGHYAADAINRQYYVIFIIDIIIISRHWFHIIDYWIGCYLIFRYATRLLKLPLIHRQLIDYHYWLFHYWHIIDIDIDIIDTHYRLLMPLFHYWYWLILINIDYFFHFSSFITPLLFAFFRYCLLFSSFDFLSSSLFIFIFFFRFLLSFSSSFTPDFHTYFRRFFFAFSFIIYAILFSPLLRFLADIVIRPDIYYFHWYHYALINSHYISHYTYWHYHWLIVLIDNIIVLYCRH